MASLERAALHYLERFAATSAGLRRVLMRKVALSVAAHGTDPQQAAGWVDDLIGRYERSGLLDDRRYAEAKAASLLRRGGSTRVIRQKLAAKGVAGALIDGALDELAREGGPPTDTSALNIDDQTADGGSLDGQAAWAYARRRRLGPFRDPAQRAARRDRDLAALARAGFPLALARRVVDSGALAQDTPDAPPEDPGWPD